MSDTVNTDVHIMVRMMMMTMTMMTFPLCRRVHVSALSQEISDAVRRRAQAARQPLGQRVDEVRDSTSPAGAFAVLRRLRRLPRSDIFQQDRDQGGGVDDSRPLPGLLQVSVCGLCGVAPPDDGYFRPLALRPGSRLRRSPGPGRA